MVILCVCVFTWFKVLTQVYISFFHLYLLSNKLKKYIFHNGLRHFWRITMWGVETVECRKYRSAVLVLFRRQSKNHLARWHRSILFFFFSSLHLSSTASSSSSALYEKDLLHLFICVWHPKRNLLLSTAVLFKAGPGVNRWVRVRGIYNAVSDWSSLSLGRYPEVGMFHEEVWRLLRPNCCSEL